MSSNGNYPIAACYLNNWKAVTGCYGFSFDFEDIYWHGPNLDTPLFYPLEAQKPWIYDIEIDYEVTYIENTWTAIGSATVMGPASGNYVTNSQSISFHPSYSLYNGLNSIKAYKLGMYECDKILTNSVIKVDNFSAKFIIPPPSGPCVMIE